MWCVQDRIEILEMLVFGERGKLEYPEKSLTEQGENQQETQPTYEAGCGNRTQATLVRGERSHHCATLALKSYIEDITCPRVDTSFIFECSTVYYINNKIEDILAIFRRFPNIFRRFPKIFQNSPNSVRSSYKHFRSFSENFRRLPNVSELSSKMFRSHRNE